MEITMKFRLFVLTTNFKNHWTFFQVFFLNLVAFLIFLSCEHKYLVRFAQV